MEFAIALSVVIPIKNHSTWKDSNSSLWPVISELGCMCPLDGRLTKLLWIMRKKKKNNYSYIRSTFKKVLRRGQSRILFPSYKNCSDFVEMSLYLYWYTLCEANTVQRTRILRSFDAYMSWKPSMDFITDSRRQATLCLKTGCTMSQMMSVD